MHDSGFLHALSSLMFFVSAALIPGIADVLALLAEVT
jgi:hypothetical protein